MLQVTASRPPVPLIAIVTAAAVLALVGAIVAMRILTSDDEGASH